jgi:prepilin-type processing-associated H-X9-DG protein
MDENLIGYLLNALDPEAHREVEARLARDAAARDRLEAMRRALEPLALDRDEFEPPAGLAARTLDRIAELAPPTLPRAPAIRSFGAVPPFWRRADFLIAACLLVTILGVGIPWVISARAQAARVACEDNMRRCYAGLKNYKELHHGRFPDVAAAAAAPRNVAALWMPILRDAQTLPEAVSVRCPAVGASPPCAWSLKELQAMEPEEFQRHVRALASGYGYSLGHRSGEVVIGPRSDPDKDTMLPIMADCAPTGVLVGNSPNHGGSGQNVLYQDGHVKFCTTRTVGFGGDDIYVNKEQKVAAGLDWMDSVIGHGAASPNP